jgi:hypothetical protein
MFYKVNVQSDPTPTLPREGVSPWGDLEGVVNAQYSIFKDR